MPERASLAGHDHVNVFGQLRHWSPLRAMASSRSHGRSARSSLSVRPVWAMGGRWPPAHHRGGGGL
jgi:hypothetical protein